MTVQQPKRRPLSRYLKDFKHSQTHCAHCHKLLDQHYAGSPWQDR